MNKKWIAVAGNPIDGFCFAGPFDEHQDAVQEAERYQSDWWIAELLPPEGAPPALLLTAGELEEMQEILITEIEEAAYTGRDERADRLEKLLAKTNGTL